MRTSDWCAPYAKHNNLRVGRGWTALIAAAWAHATDALAELLSHGADRYVADERGWTALRVAVELGHDAAVPLLVEGDRGLHDLSRAVLRRTPEAVRARLARGRDPHRRDTHGLYPLAWACALGELESTRLLLHYGADANAAGRDRYTPLLHAAKHGYAEIVSELLEAGAQVDPTGPRGWIALNYACAHGGNLEAVRLLLEAGADVNGEPHAMSPICLAAAYGYGEIVEVLLESGADPNDGAQDGSETPLMEAAKEGHHVVMRLLLGYGNDSCILGPFRPVAILVQTSSRSVRD